MTKSSVVTRDPEVMHGEAVFAGTRVPVYILMEYLEGGDTIDDFLDGYETVTREQVIAFLQEARERMLAAAE